MNNHDVHKSKYNIRTAQCNILQRNRRHLKYANKQPPKLQCYIEDTDEVPDILIHHSNPENNSSLPEQISVSSQQAIRLSRYGKPITLPARYRDVTNN